ncbi:MAG: hypothetical protein SYC29_13330, partial [Planctomycetota bacterium]|nr:hypothetical protein [Planctomycetota bacterium]
FEPRWCVEFAPRRRGIPRACLATVMRSLRPWRYWRRVKMSHRVRAGRLAAYLLLLLAGLYVLFCLSQGARAWDQWWERTHDPTFSTSSVGGTKLVIHAMLLPFSDRSLGSATYTRLRRWPGGGLLTRSYRAPGRFASSWTEEAAAAAFCGVFFAACPLVFLALPASRRRAKVRWGHIMRITAHGGSYVAIAAVIILVSGTVRRLETSPWWSRNVLAAAEAPVFIVLCAALGLWWAAAIRAYLRMEHGRAVTAAVLTTAFFAACAILFKTHPTFIVMPLSRLLFPT